MGWWIKALTKVKDRGFKVVVIGRRRQPKRPALESRRNEPVMIGGKPSRIQAGFFTTGQYPSDLVGLRGCQKRWLSACGVELKCRITVYGTLDVVGWVSNVLPANALMNSMNQQNNQPSQLFTLRVWAEPLGYDQTELRYQVRHILSGETRYFREWAVLLKYLAIRLDTGQEG